MTTTTDHVPVRKGDLVLLARRPLTTVYANMSRETGDGRYCFGEVTSATRDGYAKRVQVLQAAGAPLRSSDWLACYSLPAERFDRAEFVRLLAGTPNEWPTIDGARDFAAYFRTQDTLR